MAQVSREEAFNVMVFSIAIIVAVVFGSLLVLNYLTGNLYLNSYFLLEVLFNSQNTAASEALAALAFGTASSKLVPILLVVVVDNVSRILIVSFILAVVIDFFNYANVEGLINRLRARMLSGHVIICGYNDISERLIGELKKERARYVMIEPRREKEMELNQKRVLNIPGDFASAEVLRKAGIGRARSIVLTSDNDADNIVCVITARRLNPKIKTLSRISEESIRKKLYGVGSDMAVIPEHLAGVEIGDYLSRIVGVGNG